MTDRKLAALKLAKLPDRKTVRMTITLSAELSAKLQAYVEVYRITYGEAEEAAVLVPFIVETFIDSDRRSIRRKAKTARPNID